MDFGIVRLAASRLCRGSRGRYDAAAEFHGDDSAEEDGQRREGDGPAANETLRQEGQADAVASGWNVDADERGVRVEMLDAAFVDVDAPAVPGRFGDDHPCAGGSRCIDEQIAAVALHERYRAAVVGAFAGR